MRNHNLWDQWEENWAIEKGRAPIKHIRRFDKDFITPEIDFDKLERIASKSTIFDRFIVLIKEAPNSIFVIVGITWLFSAIWLFPKIVEIYLTDYFFERIQDYSGFLLLSTGFIFFTTLVLFFVTQRMPKMAVWMPLPSFNPKLKFALVTILIITATFGTYEGITSIARPFNPKFGAPLMVDVSQIHSLINGNLNGMIEEFKKSNISNYNRAQVNMIKAASLEVGDLKQAYITDAILKSDKFDLKGESYAAQLNKDKNSIEFAHDEFANLDTLRNGFITSYEEGMFDSLYQIYSNGWNVEFISFKDGTQESKKLISELEDGYLLLEKLGYSKKALSLLTSLLKNNPNDAKKRYNFDQFVNNYYYDESKIYDSIMIRNNVKLTTSGFEDISSRINTFSYAEIYRIKDIDVLNNLAVMFEANSDYSKSFLAYFLADQKDPFERNFALQNNYSKYRVHFSEDLKNGSLEFDSQPFNSSIARSNCDMLDENYSMLFECIAGKVDNMDAKASFDYYSFLNEVNLKMTISDK